MRSNHVDVMSRSLSSILSRRDVVRGLVGAGITLGALCRQEDTEARKRKRKRKHRKPKPSGHGCLNVGSSCNTKDQCCSGICEGETCLTRDTGTCEQHAPDICQERNPDEAACDGRECVCFRTADGSKVCAGSHHCANCQKDADCLALGFPTGSACAPMTGAHVCAGRCEDTGMACVIPCGVDFPKPAE